MAFLALKRNAAPGVDGLTWRYYEAGLEEHLQRLFAQVQSGAYRALPVRRQYIPKPDGRQRPLGIAALEDKIVQRAVVEVLNAIYEEDFLGFSYGFRPGRSQHDALDALATAITHTPVNWILDADLRSFFDSVSQSWLVRFIEHRIGDQRIIRLVRKWLKAGVLENGEISVSETGTPQGSVASPLFANVYVRRYGFSARSVGCRVAPELVGDQLARCSCVLPLCLLSCAWLSQTRPYAEIVVVNGLRRQDGQKSAA